MDPDLASTLTEIGRILNAQREAKAFEDTIEGALKQHGFQYQREPQYGSVRPDFLVRTPDGRKFVIEAKTWDDTPGNRAIAARQAKLLVEATGADGALVVASKFGGPLPEGVLDLHTLSKTFVAWAKAGKKEPQGPPALLPPSKPSGKKFVFAAMPFAPKFEDTYLAAMVPAAQDLGLECYRVDYDHFTGDIVAHIREKIESCVAVIADLSDAKPNVLYEAGYAHALRKPTIHVSSTSLAKLPFDVRNWNTIAYKSGQTTKLREPLRATLKAALKL